MPIEPLLAPGLEAFEREDYAEAQRIWKHLQGDLSEDETEILEALCLLAAGLTQQSRGEASHAARSWVEARRLLQKAPASLLGLDVAHLRTSLAASPEQGLSRPPDLRPAPRVPRRILLRFAALVLLLGAGLALLRWTPLSSLLDRDALVSLLGDLRQAWWSPLALLGLYLVLTPVGLPASPLIVSGGIVFGSFWGTVYNFLGTFGGAAASYFLGRYLGRDFVVHLLGKRLRPMEKLLNRQSFWTLARIRFIPVPFPVVNYGSALAGVKASTFLGSSALGLAPAVFLFSWFADALVEASSAGGDEKTVVLKLTAALAGILALSFLPPFLERRKRRRRYRQLIETRRGRGR